MEEAGPNATNLVEFRDHQKKGLTDTNLSKHKKGQAAEYFACCGLIAKGADVYKNITPDGKTDILITVNGDTYHVDVKLARYMSNSQGRWSWTASDACGVQDGIYPLIVEPHTGHDITGWKLRWHTNRQRQAICPPGLEDFWD